MDAVADVVETGELRDVDVHELARSSVLTLGDPR